jgi:hypothetical protein
VLLLVFKTSAGLIRSRVGSIPIRLRHFLVVHCYKMVGSGAFFFDVYDGGGQCG